MMPKNAHYVDVLIFAGWQYTYDHVLKTYTWVSPRGVSGKEYHTKSVFNVPQEVIENAHIMGDIK